MGWQPSSEKEAERQLIKDWVERKGGKVIKLQDDNDDGKTDGIIEFNGKLLNVEARRKGYPNHKGKVCLFKNGWETEFLLRDGGIFLNERTIKNNKDNGFLFIVDIKGPNGSESRSCIINKSRIEELLNQPYREQKSTNSGNMQSVKIVPLDWFEQ